VGDQFNQEKQNYTQGAATTKAQGQKQVDDNRITGDQAEHVIKESSDNYSWDGNQNSPYKENVQKIQGAHVSKITSAESFDSADHQQARDIVQFRDHM
jgi:hypothetical protein